MKVKISQNSYGRFNLLGSDSSTSFHLVIVDDEGKTVEQNGVKAHLYYSSDEDETNAFSDAIENLDWVFDKCYEYAGHVWGSTDHKAECLVFAKVYQENFEELKANYITEKTTNLERQIDNLTSQLNNLDLAQLDISYPVEKEINKYKNWLESEKTKRTQMVDGSEMAIKSDEKITDYENRVAELSTFSPHYQ